MPVNNVCKAVGDAITQVVQMERYHKHWVSDATLFQKLILNFPSLDELGITRKNMNVSMGTKYKNVIDIFDCRLNNTGVFRYKADVYCTFDKKRRNKFFYYLTSAGQGPLGGRPTSHMFPALADDDQFGVMETRKSSRDRESDLADLDGDNCSNSIKKLKGGLISSSITSTMKQELTT